MTAKISSDDLVFSSKDLARLFGCSDPTISRWISTGAIESLDVGAGTGKRHKMTPGAVLRFVRERSDCYDWRHITDERLKTEAERVDAVDPMVPVADLVKATSATAAELKALVAARTVAIVNRGSIGGPGRPVKFVRRSSIEPAKVALQEMRKRPDPITALHALLDAEDAAMGSQRARVPALVKSLGPLPAKRERCPRCNSPMVNGFADETSREQVWSCLACGEQAPLLAEASA